MWFIIILINDFIKILIKKLPEFQNISSVSDDDIEGQIKMENYQQLESHS